MYSLLRAAERARRATDAPAGAERGSRGPASDGEKGSAGAKPPGSCWLLRSQLYDETRSSSRTVFHPHAAAMELDEVLHDGEAEARPAWIARARLVHTVEALENPREILVGNSGSLV